MIAGKPMGAPGHARRTQGNQDKGKLEGREKQEHTCAGEYICVGADFTAEGTECTV